jgi:hypothetical protein
MFAVHQILFKGKRLGDVIHGRGIRNSYRILVGKPEEKRSGCRWAYSINLLALKFYFAHPVYKMQKYGTKKR